MIEPFLVPLIGIVREVQGEIDEERFGLVLLDEGGGLFDHHVGKEPAGVVHFFVVSEEVVFVGSAPVEEVRVVVDAPNMVSEGVVEALPVGNGPGMIAEMPLADVGRLVSRHLHGFGDGDFA